MNSKTVKRSEDHHVAVLGASPKPERYSNKAIRMLLQHGFSVTPVSPRPQQIMGLQVAASLRDIIRPVDTLSLYVGPERILPMIDDILALAPARVICNPGTESTELQDRLDAANIPWIKACTLVLLRKGEF
ncbi:MAG: CoA-binding protein [Gammaproteobacteria bacterium]